MATVIVITNFSESSKNALDYACGFLQHSKARVLLLNIFSFPGSYSNDGVSMAAVSETINNDTYLLEQERKRALENYPLLTIDTELISGTFTEALQEKCAEVQSRLIVMGAGGDYNSLLSWDTNIINAFIDLNVPVLVVPAHIRFENVKAIAFACNYYRSDLLNPVTMIQKLVNYTKAQLYVINVTVPEDSIDQAAEANKQLLKDALNTVDPVYYDAVYTNVVAVIDDFIKERQIDMLVVLPSRAGIWQSVFQESHTRNLVNLNQIPVLALHREQPFI